MSLFRYIFDMDGTVYHLDNRSGTTFSASAFNADLRARIDQFLARRLELSSGAAVELHARLHAQYSGSMSLAVEREFGIDRYEFFANTWNVDPARYIVPDPTLAPRMMELQGRAALLTAAPGAWAHRVLRYLGLDKVFGSYVYTGEPDLRKPDPRLFKLIAADLGAPAINVTSVGDQLHTDILPAQALGMHTIIIGPEQASAGARADNIHGALDIIALREAG